MGVTNFPNGLSGEDGDYVVVTPDATEFKIAAGKSAVTGSSAGVVTGLATVANVVASIEDPGWRFRRSEGDCLRMSVHKAYRFSYGELPDDDEYGRAALVRLRRVTHDTRAQED